MAYCRSTSCIPDESTFSINDLSYSLYNHRRYSIKSYRSTLCVKSYSSIRVRSTILIGLLSARKQKLPQYMLARFNFRVHCFASASSGATVSRLVMPRFPLPVAFCSGARRIDYFSNCAAYALAICAGDLFASIPVRSGGANELTLTDGRASSRRFANLIELKT